MNEYLQYIKETAINKLTPLEIAALFDDKAKFFEIYTVFKQEDIKYENIRKY